MTFEELERNVLKWSADRGILTNSTADKQFIKAVSEMGELADGLAKGNLFDISDAIGDVLVCLINVAELNGLEITMCLNRAYQEIKDRKGYLNEQGVFVKETA